MNINHNINLLYKKIINKIFNLFGLSYLNFKLIFIVNK